MVEAGTLQLDAALQDRLVQLGIPTETDGIEEGTGSELREQIDVSQQARRVEIPALSIQPLVENAVKHGISRKAEGGSIGLEAAPGGRRPGGSRSPTTARGFQSSGNAGKRTGFAERPPPVAALLRGAGHGCRCNPPPGAPRSAFACRWRSSPSPFYPSKASAKSGRFASRSLLLQ